MPDTQPAMTLRFTNNDVTFTNTKWSRNLLTNLDTLRQNSVFCDVTLEIPNPEPESEAVKLSFVAHSCVLVAASDVFRSILDNEITERRVIMKDFDDDVLRYCLDYIYGQEIKVPFDRVEMLKKAADTLQLKSLCTQCDVVQNTLKNKVTVDLLKTNTIKQTSSAKTATIHVSAKTRDAHEVDYLESKTLVEPESSACIERNVKNILNSEQDRVMQEDMFHVSEKMYTYEDQLIKTEQDITDDDTNTMIDSVEPTVSNEKSVFDESNSLETNKDNLDPNSVEDTVTDRNSRRLRPASRKGLGAKALRRGKHQCEYCDASFTTSGNLTQHKKKRCENPEWVPRSKYKKSDEELRETRNICRARLEKKEYTCKDCGMTLLGFKRLFRHRRTEHEKLFVCQHCDKALATQKEHANHEERCKMNPMVTDGSTRRKRTPAEKAAESASQKPKKSFMCDHCGTLFGTKKAFTTHQKQVVEDPNFVSKKDRPKQTHAEFRRKHNALRAKYEKQEYPCKECGEKFIGFKKLYVHKQKVHKKSYVCQYCNKIFEYPALLKIHEKRHRNEKEFMCSQCDYRAITMHEVKFHEQREHLNLQFQCKYCPAIFRVQQALTAHELQHKKGPVKCKYCDYATFHHNNMKTHLVSKHFPEKRELLMCNICKRQFSQRGHLNRHMKSVHGTELPHRFPSNRLSMYDNDGPTAFDIMYEQAPISVQDKPIPVDKILPSTLAPQQGSEAQTQIYGIQYVASGDQIELSQSLEQNNIMIQEPHSATESLIIHEVDELEGVVYYYADDVSAQ